MTSRVMNVARRHADYVQVCLGKGDWKKTIECIHLRKDPDVIYLL